MKLWKGKKRYAMRLMNRLASRKILKWALTVKPGDYIATCEGCNRQVAEIAIGWTNEGQWMRGRPNKTSIIYEVQFTDTHGRYHFCPGGGCAYPVETPEQVTNYWKAWASRKLNPWYEGNPVAEEVHKKLNQAFLDNKPIVDQHGELLPEFDMSRL